MDGMIVKALDESFPGRSGEAQRKFLLYKEKHPEKLLLLHFNGNARDPAFDQHFFTPTSWTYYVGAEANGAISADTKTVNVKDISPYKVGMKGVNTFNDPVALVPKSSQGELLWKQAEYATVEAIDEATNTLRLSRGKFGTTAKEYGNGQLYIAPIVTDIPPNKDIKRPLWRYNYSYFSDTTNTAKQLHDNLIHYLREEGSLNTFDGISFDVIAHTRPVRHWSRDRKIDYNLDGKFSNADIESQANYSKGVYTLFSLLRASLPNKLIMSDGSELNQQRGFGLLNGIENEAWPSLWDKEIDLWYTGINRLNFWNSRSIEPSFNYIKIGKMPMRGKGHYNPAENYRRLRVASALLTGTTIAPSYKANYAKVDRWPELIGSKRAYNRWLGTPKSEFNYLFLKQDQEQPIIPQVKKLTERSIEVLFNVKDRADIHMTYRFKLNNLPTHSPAGLVTLRIDQSKEPFDSTWADEGNFTSHFQLYNLEPGVHRIHITSDNGNLSLDDYSIIHAIAIPYREFDNGLVIANPTSNKISIDQHNLPKNMSYLGKIEINKKDALIRSFSE
ncbi:hypothetical protein [Vibrio sp. 10N]|uniref:hypothetical protein n=1 Tax=Vibrio sp. 10N TaxID=3058938 RepID=UPI002812C1ED|nr:hypothetical protein VB10N_29120 [Vibrio sp. 10N]